MTNFARIGDIHKTLNRNLLICLKKRIFAHHKLLFKTSMKRILLTIITTISLTANASAQARFTSNTETVNLGQIEWKYPTKAQYTITNTGNQPVLTQVEPDCACAVAQWTKTPIAPGKKGSIEVTFDAKALGHFEKGIAIYTNAEPHLVWLKLKGEVVMQLKDFSKTHPYQIGQIRLNKDEITFPDTHLGERPQIHISVVNLGEAPYEPVLMHLPSYLQMEVKPRVLQQGERGTITLTLNSDRLTDYGLTQSSVYLAKFAGDKVSEENELPLSAVLLPDFSSLTETEKLNAPAIKLSATQIDMSATLAKKKRAKQDILLTNTGKSPLIISKLQVFHPAVGVSMKKGILMPGESTPLRVTVTKKNIGKKRRNLKLLMITNDPAKTKVEIEIIS